MDKIKQVLIVNGVEPDYFSGTCMVIRKGGQSCELFDCVNGCVYSGGPVEVQMYKKLFSTYQLTWKISKNVSGIFANAYDKLDDILNHGDFDKKDQSDLVTFI